MAAATDSSAGFATLRCVRLWMSQRGTDPQSEYGGKSSSAEMGFWVSIAILMNHRGTENSGIETTLCYSLASIFRCLLRDDWQNPNGLGPALHQSRSFRGSSP